MFPAEGHDQGAAYLLPSQDIRDCRLFIQHCIWAYHKPPNPSEGRKRPASVVENSASQVTNDQKAATASMAAQVAMLLASLLTFIFLVALDATSIVLAVSVSPYLHR